MLPCQKGGTMWLRTYHDPHMEVSLHGGTSPKIIHLNRILGSSFDKPSILG
jgi:hypothetical protein